MTCDSNMSINLRTEHLDFVIQDARSPEFFEIIADNWLSEGPHHRKLETIRRDHSLFFHCVGMNLGGYDSLRFEYLNQIRQLVGKFQPKLISDHLCVQAHHGIYVHDLLPFPLTRARLHQVAERIDTIQNFLDRQILIENLSYYVAFETSEMSEFEFINELSAMTGCGILLDLNNIDVNEQNGIASSEDFLSGIHLEHVKEIHIAGGESQGDLVVDTHGSWASPVVLEMLKNILSVKPETPVIYERDLHVPEYAVLKSYLGKVATNAGI